MFNVRKPRRHVLPALSPVRRLGVERRRAPKDSEVWCLERRAFRELVIRPPKTSSVFVYDVMYMLSFKEKTNPRTRIHLRKLSPLSLV